ncbi:CAAX amino protease [Longispora fulva]|uniref:Energy-converting hydrogenase Eha subunit E n=1 Tax=Longispora fulva TaxID=619741 RepID=A0A8J7GK41_9ACTN|nr:CPBP family intramembrane glutamic endopeptidase [Longispora fulva]MBG6138098.1 energy-converting hydrogenase Eha subunit E [Longispora fulva]GIG60351.1 CAAX amino protease [Longispora fulva]
MDLLVRVEAPLTSPSRPRLQAALAGSVALLAGTAVMVSMTLPSWAYPLWNTAMALVLLGGALAVGLTPARLGITVKRRTVIVATIGVLAVVAVYAIGLALPATRAAFHDNRAAGLGVGGLAWAMLVRVPFGTVLIEELAFRGVLPALMGADGQTWRWQPVLGASALFGLWHFFPALHLAQHNQAVHALLGSSGTVIAPLVAMLAAMGAGVFLSAWRHAGRGLLAPFLFHTATNAGGYMLAWILLPS